MGERPSEYARDAADWYIEPTWTVAALAQRVPLTGGVHDPCCGMGTIPKTLGGTGSDIIDRGFGYPARDFLSDTSEYENIATNPPYGIAQQIIEHALNVARDRVAALVQVKFLASQRRYGLFSRPDMERVIMFSRRPSMPPGEMLMREGEACRGGGSIDFCWTIWKRGHMGATTIEWTI